MPFLNLGDSLALAIPFGIFAVRLANFLNGELYGRVTSPDLAWAMRFPTDPVALRLLNADTLSMRGKELRIGAAFDSGLWERVREQVPPRHPSQLYEAVAEGVLLGFLLWGLFILARHRRMIFPSGVYGAVFLVGYGVFRSFLELFRQPDSQFREVGDPLGTVFGPLTMGQVLSSVMIAGGIALLAWIWRGRRPPA